MAEKSWQGHTGKILENSEDFDVIACSSCGFAHTVPIPSEQDLVKVYREEYYATEKPLYIERYREDQDWWNLVYAERYDLFEELLPTGGRRILDVGSGPGLFLLAGKERGWSPLGIEPSAQSAKHTRELGLEVVEDFLNHRSSQELGRFDVVHMSQVLEHIPDPRAMLELAWDMLLPGGLLCVVVPNDFNPFQKALRDSLNYDAWWVAPPHHINYFNFESLQNLLSRCGFEIKARETTFPIDMFLLMGECYIGDDALGRACHERRKSLEKNLESAGLGRLKKRLYNAMAELGIGREVVLVGRRPVEAKKS